VRSGGYDPGAQDRDPVKEADSFDLVGVLAQVKAGGVARQGFADVGVDGDDVQGAVQGVEVCLAGDASPSVWGQRRRR
jgi:hypothetical protein